MKVLEVRRTMHGWIVEVPGAEEAFSDGIGQSHFLSTNATEVQYCFTEKDGTLTVKLSKESS